MAAVPTALAVVEMKFIAQKSVWSIMACCEAALKNFRKLEIGKLLKRCGDIVGGTE